MISLNNIEIAAISAAVPAQRESFEGYAEKFGNHNIERIIQSTGIRCVHVAGELSTGDLCEAAARQLFESTNYSALDIDAVVVITQTPDDLMPGVAFKLQHRLGLRADCLVFDINQGCNGYIYGLFQASMLINAGCKHVLLCTGDVTSKLLDASDRNVKMVFGDAATATVVKIGTSRLDFLFESDGSGRDSLCTQITYNVGPIGGRVGRLHMEGQNIMNFALTKVPPVFSRLLGALNVKRDELDLVVFHQANKFMIRYLQKLLHLRSEIVPVDMEEYGNTGPSSIPLMLANNGKRFSCRERVILCGFGIGLSIGVVSLSLSGAEFILPVEIM